MEHVASQWEGYPTFLEQLLHAFLAAKSGLFPFCYFKTFLGFIRSSMDVSRKRGDFWQYSKDDLDTVEANVASWLLLMRTAAKRGDLKEENDIMELMQCLAIISEATSSSDLYCSTFVEQDGLKAAVRLLSSSNEDLIDKASAIIANCSGPMAAIPSVKIFKVNDKLELKLKEMSFGEGGLGWKVWGTAVFLAHQLAENPSLVFQKSVLELGSGCGLGGFVAAKLGAKSITLTDCVPAILDNLRENAKDLPSEVISSKNSWDYTFHEKELKVSSEILIRFLEWAEDSGLKNKAAETEVIFPTHDIEGEFPRIPQSVTFETIIASDIIYQASDIDALVAVIKKRLKWPSGVCHITHTVRSTQILELWIKAFEASSLKVAFAKLDPREFSQEERKGDNSLFFTESATSHSADYYEGGFVTITVTHEQHN